MTLALKVKTLALKVETLSIYETGAWSMAITKNKNMKVHAPHVHCVY